MVTIVDCYKIKTAHSVMEWSFLRPMGRRFTPFTIHYSLYRSLIFGNEAVLGWRLAII